MDFLAKVTIPSITGQPRDAVTNQFVFHQANGDGDEWVDEMAAWATRFYNTIAPGGLAAMGSFLSNVLDDSADACVTEVYDITGHLDGSPAGSPVASLSWTLAAAPAIGGSSALPSEVAYVVTLEAVGRAAALAEALDGGDAGTAPDRPKQRHTGRIYVGPLNTGALTVVDGVARPSAAIRDTAISQMKRVAEEAFLSVDCFLGIWSRKDQIVRQINAVSVDNAFDTQRRRGESSTLRTRSLVP